MPTQNLQFEGLLECYQYIGAHLVAAVSEPWRSIELTVLIDEESVLHTATYDPQDGSRRKGAFTVDSPPEYAFAFYDLRELTSDKDRGFFQRLIFRLDSNGDYDVEFDYDVENIGEEKAAMALRPID